MKTSKKIEDQMCDDCKHLWLHYYNRVLFDSGLITENEHNQMATMINAYNRQNQHRATSTRGTRVLTYKEKGYII